MPWRSRSRGLLLMFHLVWVLAMRISSACSEAWLCVGAFNEETMWGCSPRPAQNVPIHTLAMIHLSFLGLIVVSSVSWEFAWSEMRLSSPVMGTWGSKGPVSWAHCASCWGSESGLRSFMPDGRWNWEASWSDPSTALGDYQISVRLNSCSSQTPRSLISLSLALLTCMHDSSDHDCCRRVFNTSTIIDVIFKNI